MKIENKERLWKMKMTITDLILKYLEAEGVNCVFCGS